MSLDERWQKTPHRRGRKAFPRKRLVLPFDLLGAGFCAVERRAVSRAGRREVGREMQVRGTVWWGKCSLDWFGIGEGSSFVEKCSPELEREIPNQVQDDVWRVRITGDGMMWRGGLIGLSARGDKQTPGGEKGIFHLFCLSTAGCLFVCGEGRDYFVMVDAASSFAFCCSYFWR